MVIPFVSGRVVVAVATFGAGLIAGLAIQQPRVSAAKDRAALVKAQCDVDLTQKDVATLERLVAGEKAAREALAAAQQKAKETTDAYQREISRLSGVVSGLPRRVSLLCNAARPAPGGGAGGATGDPAAPGGGVVHPGDGEPARPDFDARPWRAYAMRAEEVAAGLRACLQ